MSEENGYIVDATGVHKTYSTGKVTVPALRGIDLRVKRGEMVAIMGAERLREDDHAELPFGAGRHRLRQGYRRGAGDPRPAPDDDAQRLPARGAWGSVFQLYNLLPVLSAVENVEMPLLVSGISSKEARRRSLELLEQVGLADRADHLPAELSGGQRQRVTIARALVNRPAIVWADEPTGDLDSETAHEVMDLMIRLNKDSGETFVIVTPLPRGRRDCRPDRDDARRARDRRRPRRDDPRVRHRSNVGAKLPSSPYRVRKGALAALR